MKSKKILLAILVFLGMILLGTSKSSAMSADEAIDWVKGQCGQTIYGGECVGLIQAYYDHLGLNRDGVYGNACDYATNKVPDGCTRLQGVQPQKGDILVYTGGTYGHVAIYESDYVTYHQNYSGRYVRQISNYYQDMYVYWNSQTDYLKLNYWGVIRPNFEAADTEAPVIHEAYVDPTSMDGNKYTVYAKVTDNKGINKIPVMSAALASDSAYGEIRASRTSVDYYSAIIKASDHNNDKGIYNSHVYAYDDAGNGVLKALDSIPMASKIVTNLGDFTAKIVLKDNKNYAISAEGTNANANVSLAQKSSNDSGQIWQFRKKSDGKSYEIINVASGKLLDVFNAKDENKANVEIYPQNGNIAQTFYIMEYNGGYRIVAKCSANLKAIDLTGGTAKAGQNIELYNACSMENSAQTWTFEKVATSISMNVSSAVVRKGETKQLSVKLNPTDVANKSVKWTTSNSQIATVSSTGVVKGIKEGKVTITATTTDGSNKKATCNVTITLPFKDLSPSDWEYSAVEYMYNRKYISGTSTTTFSPNMKLTRGMLVTILHNMEGKPYVAGKCKFPDVQNTQEYYYNAIKWASSNKIVSGYNNGKFGPNDNITREQLAVILWKYSKYKGTYKTVKADYSKFTDSKNISSFAKEGMNWAVGAGVITGSNKKLNPQGYATRSEAVSMIYKYCTKVKK